MDPVTALGVATTAFNTIKKGFSLGKDAQSMMSDVGKWMSAIENVKNPTDKKSKKVANVEQEALDEFAAKKKAEQMEGELKNYMIATFGMKAWDELLRIQGQIRKKRKMEIAYQKKQREDMINAIIVFLGIGVGGFGLIFAFAFYAWFSDYENVILQSTLNTELVITNVQLLFGTIEDKNYLLNNPLFITLC